MSGKKADGQSGGVMGWISSACRFAADRNDFRRFVTVVNSLPKLETTRIVLLQLLSEMMFKCIVLNTLPAFVMVSLFHCYRNLLVNLGLFAAGVWVARNLSDFDLMSPQPVT